MANLVMAMAAIAVLMTGALTFTTALIAGADSSADAFEVASDFRQQTVRSSLRHVPGCVIPLGATISATIENDGQSSLRAFVDWDVIAHYQSNGSVSVERLVYSETAPATSGRWILTNLVLVNGRSEAFGPGVLDPGERATVTVELQASAIASGLNKLTVATGEGAVVEIPFDGTTTCGYYLHNDPSSPSGDTTSRADLPADAGYPGGTTLYNYDTDNDAAAGRLLLTGGSGAAETDLSLYQNWRTAALTDPLSLSGTVRVEFWAAVKDFNTTARGDVTVYLRDYDGASYIEIGNVTVASDPWDTTASGTWVKATAAVSGLNYTLPIGNRLEIKMIVPLASGDDMWLAYDTISYPASVTIADSLDVVAHADEQRTGDLTSYLLKTSLHDDGYYLHNSPSPPTGGTNSQANLPASIAFPSSGTLFNYDIDRDSQPGRVLLQGGSGAGEADLAKYQNWRTAGLTEPLEISGPVSINLWSAVKDFDTSLSGELKVFLRDFDGSSYTEIADGTLNAGPWDAGATGTWVNRLLEIPAVDYTLAAGNQLELKVIVGGGSGGDMWLAYDTADQASVLRLPGQRDASPGGRPLNVTVDVDGSTGRFSPDPNGGRLIFPLLGYTRITDATWTVNYRVKRDGYGFAWLTDGIDVTPSIAGSWQTIDLSLYVEAGSTGAVIEVINTGNSKLAAVARGGDDTREYVPDGKAQELIGNSHRWQVVGINSALEIQGYVDNTADLLIRLVGYTGGIDPVYIPAPPDITPATTGSWTTIDVSAYVDADAKGVILFLDATGANATYGVRETGSSFSDTAHRIETGSNTMYFVGIDGSDQFDIYLQNGTVDVYLIAHTDQSVGYYVDDLAVTDPTLNLWEDVDADTYGVPAAANGLILHAVNDHNIKNEFGVRKNGSSDDLDRSLTAQGHLQGAVGLDVGNVWEEFLGNANVNVSIAAYTTALSIDSQLHADMDVLVRKSNGEIRATLGTNVANTANIGVADGWVTVTSTFTPAEYIVVDQTDYLEFVLYADITINDSNASIEFRIDDNTIEAVDQTGIGSLGLYRE